MALPAIREYRRLHGESVLLAVLTKEKLKSFWELVPYVDAILTLGNGLTGVNEAADSIRRLRIDEGVCFTNSFRSALPCWVSRVSTRKGTPGHGRKFLLTDVISLSGLESRHQSYEYSRLLGIPDDRFDGITRLIDLDCGRKESCSAFGLPDAGRFIAMIPGAARGPSKQWPSSNFSQSIQRILKKHPHHVVLLGSGAERELCEEISKDAGPRVHVLAGRTSIRQMAEVLSLADLAIVNDSGGMHLAAAVGTRVVALYGLTDPSKTGPLGLDHEILAAPGYERGRNIPRTSQKAVEALSRISVDEVMLSIDRVLGKLTS